MLFLTIPDKEYYDEAKNEFITVKGQIIQLEHSLVSVSKWEAKWKQPFLDRRHEKTIEQTIDYIRCMTITQNVRSELYYSLSDKQIGVIEAYILDPMTATWFPKNDDQPKSRRIMTSEVIYWEMIALQIPFECQKWHLNRLLTLIQVCNAENSPKKKMSAKEAMEQRRALNAARRKKLGTRG